MELGIAGKWALVCGASKGLGFGCAQALVREGVHVVMVARGAEALEAAVAKLLADPARPADTAVQHVAADITTVEGRAKVFALRSDYDIVVTNAGGPPPGDFRSWDREAWIKAVDANMLTPIELIKATVDKHGRARIRPHRQHHVQRGEGTDRHPGPVQRRAQRPDRFRGGRGAHHQAGLGQRDDQQPAAGHLRHRPDQGHHGCGAAQKTGKSIDELKDARRKLIPAQRFGNPDEFGAACAFLCSQHAGYITGQNILTDGGAYPGTY